MRDQVANKTVWVDYRTAAVDKTETWIEGRKEEKIEVADTTKSEDKTENQFVDKAVDSMVDMVC